MPGVKRKEQPRTFEVLVSFSGMDKGEQFTQPADDLGWALQFVEKGYLRDVTPSEEVAGDERGSEG